MPNLHFAYTFDSKLAHKQLYEQIVENGVVHPLRLREIAIKIINQASSELLMLLSIFRYGNYWLEDDDVSNSYLWYIIYIVTFLKESPSLSNNRHRNSQFILEKTLPLAGWELHEINSLIFGRPVESLMTKTGFTLLAKNLNLDSGCLGRDDIDKLKTMLVETRSTYSVDEEAVTQLKGLFVPSNWNFSEIFDDAIADAIDMLAASEKYGDDLYLYRD